MKKIVKKIAAVAMAMSLVGTGFSTLKNDNVVSASVYRHDSWCSRVEYPGRISSYRLPSGKIVQMIHFSCPCGHIKTSRQITLSSMY